jgi:hypothetical protein
LQIFIIFFIYINIYINNTKYNIYIYNIILNRAGPAQTTGPDSAQNCWADLGPKWVGPISAQNKKHIIFWARPGPEDRAGPGSAWPKPKRGGRNYFPPTPACRTLLVLHAGKEKEMNARMRRKVTWRGGGCASLAVLRQRLVAVA